MVSKVEKLILAVKSKETMAVLERWQFDIRNEKDDPSYTNNGASPSGSGESAPPKTEQQIQEEIQAIMRQITACVTFLPMLDGKCKEEPRYSFTIVEINLLRIVSNVFFWSCPIMIAFFSPSCRHLDNPLPDSKRRRSAHNVERCGPPPDPEPRASQAPILQHKHAQSRRHGRIPPAGRLLNTHSTERPSKAE